MSRVIHMNVITTHTPQTTRTRVRMSHVPHEWVMSHIWWLYNKHISNDHGGTRKNKCVAVCVAICVAVCCSSCNAHCHGIDWFFQTGTRETTESRDSRFSVLCKRARFWWEWLQHTATHTATHFQTSVVFDGNFNIGLFCKVLVQKRPIKCVAVCSVFLAACCVLCCSNCSKRPKLRFLFCKRSPSTSGSFAKRPIQIGFFCKET